MDFTALQAEFADLTMDTATTWAAGGTLNKASINQGYETVFDMLKNSSVIKNQIFTAKVSVTITDKAGTLPADFDTMCLVSINDFDTSSDIEGLTDDQYYDYIVKGTVAGSKTIILETDQNPIYVRYVPERTDLSAGGNVPNLPQEIHRSIIDFAMVEYYRRQRDDIGTANALDFAQKELTRRLSNLF